VEASAPLIETSTAQIGKTFESREATDLPIGTGFDALALLVPGAATVGDAGFSNTNGAGISMNGQRGRSNNFNIDGQANNDNSVAGPSYFMSNQDLIQEFQVISNNFSAEYGRNMGSVINYVTKSGTNNWHGTAFWFWRGNSTASLRNEEKSSLLGGDGVVPRLVNNRYGFTFGGPIVKNKAWFFVSGLNERERSSFTSSSGTSLTPTPQGLLDLENTYCGVAYATYTPDPCPSHPALGALLTFGPWSNLNGNPQATPTCTLGVDCLIVTDVGGVNPVEVERGIISRRVSTPFDDWQASARVDWQVTDKDHFFARFLHDNSLLGGATGRFAAGNWVDIPARDKQYGLDWSHNFTNNVVNQARWSYSRAWFGFLGQAGDTNGINAACVTSNPLACSYGVSMTGANLSFGQQNNLPQDRLVNNTQMQDNLVWVMGKHTFKMGGEYDRQRSPSNFLPNQNGTFTFSSLQNLVRNATSSTSLAAGPNVFNFKEQDYALYFQDDWKVRENLTLNIGVRWEAQTQAINLLHDITVARESDPAQQFWIPSLPITDRTVPEIPTDWNNWGPNFGFAYAPYFWDSLFGHGKTVIRGGYRIAYDPGFYNIFLNVATAAPTVTALTFGAGAAPVPANAFTGQDVRDFYIGAFVPGVRDPRTSSWTQVSNTFHNPYTQQWSLGIERELNRNMAFEVRYVGNHTVGNFATVNANPVISGTCPGTGIDPNTGAACAANTPGTTGLFVDFPGLVPDQYAPCTTPEGLGFAPGVNRINCERVNVRERQNSAFSVYHGLQTRFDVKSWHNLSASFGYTWSRAIDNTSEIFSTFAGGNTVADSMDPFAVDRPERGVSGTSYPHIFTMNWIYDLPFYRNQEGVIGHILGGWQLNGVYRYTSGQPFTPAQFGYSNYCQPSFQSAFFSSVSNCRPILSDPSAPIDSVGFCTDATLPDCGIEDFQTGAPGGTYHWIANSTQAALFFGSPYLGVGRNTLRGQSINNLDLSVYKTTKITERFSLQAQATGFNVFNRQFRGVPDPFIEDGALVDGGSFMNNFFNGSNRRSMTFGLKLIF
jgi:outer membrane receptor protein involved in Fe transport